MAARDGSATAQADYSPAHRPSVRLRARAAFPAHRRTDGRDHPGARDRFLTIAGLATLEAIGKLPVGSPAAKTLRAWLRQDLEAGWSKLAAQRAEPQQTLELGPTPDELPL
jgi:hypothetical protein